MAVSRPPASADPGPTAHTLNGAAARPPPVPFSDEALWARVTRYARCADSTLDPDQWFPVSAEADKARHEAAAAITVCTTCLVRTQCLGHCRCGIGISASTVSGAAWSPPTARHCAAGSTRAQSARCRCSPESSSPVEPLGYSALLFRLPCAGLVRNVLTRPSGQRGRAGLAASGHRVTRLLVAHGVWGWLPVWLSWPAVARTATASSTPRTAVAVSGIV
jgi:hypothetical protein